MLKGETALEFVLLQPHHTARQTIVSGGVCFLQRFLFDCTFIWHFSCSVPNALGNPGNSLPDLQRYDSNFLFITQQPCMIVSSDASGLINTNYMYLLFIFVVGIIFFVFLDAVRAYVVQPCDMQIFMQKYDNFRKTNDV
jgi:hypothetical protein